MIIDFKILAAIMGRVLHDFATPCGTVMMATDFMKDEGDFGNILQKSSDKLTFFVKAFRIIFGYDNDIDLLEMEKIFTMMKIDPKISLDGRIGNAEKEVKLILAKIIFILHQSTNNNNFNPKATLEKDYIMVRMRVNDNEKEQIEKVAKYSLSDLKTSINDTRFMVAAVLKEFASDNGYSIEYNSINSDICFRIEKTNSP